MQARCGALQHTGFKFRSLLATRKQPQPQPATRKETTAKITAKGGHKRSEPDDNSDGEASTSKRRPMVVLSDEVADESFETVEQIKAEIGLMMEEDMEGVCEEDAGSEEGRAIGAVKEMGKDKTAEQNTTCLMDNIT